MADVVRAADVHKGLAGLPSRNGFLALVVRQFWLAPHHPTPLATARSRPSLVRLRINSRSNSAATQDRQHQPAVRGGGVRPGVPQKAD